MSVVATPFRAMNTDILVLSPDQGRENKRAVDTVQRIFAEVEQCLSRFRPDSELSGLNRSNGKPFHASPLLFQAVSLALSAAEATSGLFDPTILSALEAAGYDRSFERGPRPGTARQPRRRANHRLRQRPDYRSISLDAATSTIRLTAGLRLDLGGIGKGLAVDLALAATEELPNRCINAGGDLAARGSPESDEGWTVALEDGGQAAPVSVQLRDVALATSTTLKRRWITGGEGHHHLIDPRTGHSSTSPLRSVSVVATTCVQADVAAKTALLLGADALAFLVERGLHGFAIRQDGSTIRTPHWPRVPHPEGARR